MKKALVFALALAIFGLGAMPATAEAADKPLVRTSGQPCLHGFPIWYAEKTGQIDKAPFASKFVFFPSGAPQTEALAAGEWECGATGTIPCMLANMRYGMKIIAISNDESETNDLWVRPDSPLLKTKGANPNYPNIYGTPEDWKGKKILCTTVSTGHYALTMTLKALGLNDKDTNIVHIEQGQAITAFKAGQGDIIQLWAPFSYMAEANGWKKVSSGARAGAMVPGGVGVDRKFAEEHPDLVVAWLDVYMKNMEMLRDDPEGSLDKLYAYFTDYCGIKIDKELLKNEFTLRPKFNVAEQIKHMEDPNGMPKWMDGIAKFMLDQGRIREKEYERFKKNNYGIDVSFMKKLAEVRAAQQK